MAPLPTIGNAVRVACNWNAPQGVTPVNVLHVITNSTDEAQIGSDLFDAMSTNVDMWQYLATGMILQSLTITLLDGSSASQVFVAPDTTVHGDQSGEAIPSAAAVLSFHTNQRGPRGRGRLYIGPITESSQHDGLLDAGVNASSVAAWNAFNDDIAASTSVMSLGVASYTHADIHGVTSISMRIPYGCQRRRQNQRV